MGYMLKPSRSASSGARMPARWVVRSIRNAGAAAATMRRTVVPPVVARQRQHGYGVARYVVLGIYIMGIKRYTGEETHICRYSMCTDRRRHICMWQEVEEDREESVGKEGSEL